MCFSIGASFGAGAVLLTIGYAAVSQARTKERHILCVIPLIFSLQQFIEGLLWLALQRPAYAQWQQPLIYLFLLLAQVVWPLWLPLSVLLIEAVPLRKKILKVLFAAGILTAGCFLYGLLVYDADANIRDHHINYVLDFPLLREWYGGIPYLLTAVGAPLISSDSRMRLIGALLLASYLITRILYKDQLISVWCYFAAIVSVVALYDIILIDRNIRRSTGKGHLIQ